MLSEKKIGRRCGSLAFAIADGRGAIPMWKLPASTTIHDQQIDELNVSNNNQSNSPGGTPFRQRPSFRDFVLQFLVQTLAFCLQQAYPESR
jgi:hypothetical protein